MILFDLDIFRSFQIPTILSVHHLRLVVPGFLYMYIYRRIDNRTSKKKMGRLLLMRSCGRCCLFTWSLLGCCLRCICKVGGFFGDGNSWSRDGPCTLGCLGFIQQMWQTISPLLVFKVSFQQEKVYKMVFLMYWGTICLHLVISKIMGGQKRSER